MVSTLSPLSANLADETVGTANAQELAFRVCVAEQNEADLKKAHAEAQATMNSIALAKAARTAMQNALDRQAEAIATSQEIQVKGKRLYERRTRRPLERWLCKKVDEGPEHWPVLIQHEACQLVKGRALMHAGKLPTSKYDIEIQKKSDAFKKLTGHPPDLTDCEKEPVALAPERPVDAKTFGKGCFYLLSSKVLMFASATVEHYFVGVATTTKQNEIEFDAMGSCIKDDCPDEIKAFRKIYGTSDFSKKLDRKPKCTTDFPLFRRAFVAGAKEVKPDDSDISAIGDTASFILVPITCGLSKPCYQSAVKAWDAIAKHIKD